jgi:glycosyltransferase involved in cell wall biosynthesis
MQIPLCVTVNSSPEKPCQKLLTQKGVHAIAVSESVQANLVQTHKIPRAKTTVIHNGIDLKRYPQQDNALETEADRQRIPVVGTLGTLTPHKGQRSFLQAAANVLKKRPETEFVIMGRGPDLPHLRALARELGITNRVIFTEGATFSSSVISHEEMLQEAVYLKEFDIFVEPSTQEGLGLSAMQAMAWARPVIASGVGGLYTLIKDGVTGTLVPKESPEALAAAIVNLLDNPKKARAMGLQGRERIDSEFNIRDIAQQYIRLYASLVPEITA